MHSSALTVLYLGVVKNEDRAIASLGGIGSIAKVCYLWPCFVLNTCLPQAARKECRLEFRFRPQDNLCKPAFAKPGKVTNLVLKIRKKKTITAQDTNFHSTPPSFEYSVSVLGVVETLFEFPGKLR